MADAAPPEQERLPDARPETEPVDVPGDPLRGPPDRQADPVLRGEQKLPPPAATPRPGRVGMSRPSLTGAELRPIPRTPTPRRLAGEGAPAAPRPGTGIVYPMPRDSQSTLGGAPNLRPGDDDIPPAAGGSRPSVHGAVTGPKPGPGGGAGGPAWPSPMHLSPRMTAIFGGLFGLAMVTSTVALLIQGLPLRSDRALTSSSARAGASPAETAAPRPEPKRRVRVPVPGPWRLSELEKEPGITVERGTMDRKSLFEVLGDKGVPKSEVYRVIKSLDEVRKFDKSHKKDRFAVALAGKKVKAFEYEVSPSEIYQAREGEGGLLTGAKLDMKVAEEEYAGSFYVGSDLSTSFQAGGFEDGILGALDEALAGHMSTEGFEEGGTVRVIAVEETALGLFSHYKRIVALEYRPPDPSARPVRIYAFNGEEARGYWDDKGRQPFAGGWRTPCPGAPVTSRFNPKRMHPVLHKIMPHTGTDFGAPMGAPIYAAYRGVVESAGPLGPCGNAVVIDHKGGITTGYCHMSRFAGLKAGDHVGTHQLVGYVGATGRATGPHLHFFAKKDGVFFDALTLHLDGDRAVPTVDRAGFLAAKEALDHRLDGIPLPEPPPPPENTGHDAGAGAPEPVAAAAPAAAGGGGKEARASGGARHGAVQVGSPELLAAARAEPGIHPSQLVEVKGGDDDDVVLPGSVSTAAPSNAAPRRPDPAEEEDDEK